MGHFWDSEKNYGWPGEEPKPVVILEKTIEEKGIQITLQKIEYHKGEEKFPHRDEVALILPSGYKLSRSNRSTLVSLISEKDTEYLESLVKNKILIHKFINPFGYIGYGLIAEEIKI